MAVVTRLRLDAALYEPAPPRHPRQNGRPRLKGARLLTLAAGAADPTTAWAEVTVARSYGREPRTSPDSCGLRPATPQEFLSDQTRIRCVSVLR